MATETGQQKNAAPQADAGTETQTDIRESRAKARPIEAGSSVDCSFCGERVKFQAKFRLQQVICNVYVDGRWDRVEHFHAACYEEADQPFGEAESHTYRQHGSAAVPSKS